MPFDADLHGPADPGRRSVPSVALGLKRGVRRCCPACGAATLFDGYLSVVARCPACGNRNGQYPSDDFAPYVTIFLVLHLMVPVLIAVDHIYTPSVWAEAAVALPVFTLAVLALLPFAKGGVIGFAWALGVTREGAATLPGADVDRP